MTCNGMLGKQTTFSDSTGLIGYITDISGFEPSIDSIDATTYGDGTWRDFCPGLKDGGSVNITYRLIDGDPSQNRLYNRALGDPSMNIDTYTITLPSGKTVIFSAFITGVPLEIPLADHIKMSVNFKLSGAITGTLGS